MPWYIVHEIDVDQDAHTATAHTSRAAFDSRRRAIDYARRSVADAVTVSDPQGNVIYPEEARV
jgi:hypothetical protein